MKPTILLYDSGMGGLTIYDEIRKVLPKARYLYCFDNAYFPYSEKSEAILIERAINIVQKIAEKQPLDVVIVACNTASTVVLPALRESFDFPIVGTVPAIKPAAVISETKTIGLLATKGTISSNYVKVLIEKYAKDCTVEMIGTTELVEMAEEKQWTNRVDMRCLQQIVQPWINNSKLDTVILGCTHFPLMREELKQLLPYVRYFVDPGMGIAKHVNSLLEKRAVFQAVNNLELKNEIFCTADFKGLGFKQNLIKKWGFKQLSTLNV